MSDTLTVSKALALREVMRAVLGNLRMTRVEHGVTMTGRARAFTDVGGWGLRGEVDVRDAYVAAHRDDTGALVTWPVRDLMAEILAYDPTTVVLDD